MRMIICGGEDFVDMEEFGRERKGWLSEFLELPNAYFSCGKKRCSCLDSGNPKLHGPYYVWVRRIDGRQINMANTGNAGVFGARLWEELQSRGMDGDDLAQMMADGAPWIWNLAELHFPGVPQLLDDMTL